MKKKKMYLMKYEVIATSVADAIRNRNRVLYEVTLAEPSSWPEEKNKKTGFIITNNKKSWKTKPF